MMTLNLRSDESRARLDRKIRAKRIAVEELLAAGYRAIYPINDKDFDESRIAKKMRIQELMEQGNGNAIYKRFPFRCKGNRRDILLKINHGDLYDCKQVYVKRFRKPVMFE